MRAALLALLLLLAAAAPADLGDFSYAQRLGNTVQLGARFRDGGGPPVALGAVLAGRPAILALGYFHCPNLCGFVRADLYDGLARAGLHPGADYTLIALSIDPAETGADAAAARREDAARFADAGAAHYLTGSAADVRAVSDAVGFCNRFDAASKQFLHPAGIVFLAPDGAVSGYLLGLGYRPGDLRLGLAAARTGRVAAAAAPVLLLCFHFDPTTGRYSLAVMKLLRLAGAITVLVLGGVLYLAFRRERRPAL